MGASKSKPLPPALKDLAGLDPKEFEKYNIAFNNGGMSELKRKVDEDKDKWKNVPVNIAVTGNSGVGKSSFINSFRGVEEKSEGGAKTDVVESTTKPTKYIHPINQNLALWDLPGVGTPKFEKEKYLQQVSFDQYDFFVIATSVRFTENDIWLANEVRRLGKNFLFIRTKMALDVLNDKYVKGNSKDETVKKIQLAMSTAVVEAGFKTDRVFLIDNYFPLDFDFPDLVEKMINEAPIWKQEAMTLTLTNLTESLIQRKKDSLQKRIMIVAMGSAAAGAVPLPGIGLVVDTQIICGEILIYRTQLGLDDDSLRKNARSLNTTVEHLTADLNLCSHLLGSSAKSIISFVATLVCSEVAETVTAIAIPIIGSVIGGTISYGSTVAILRSILNSFVTDALAINQRLMQQRSTQSLS